MEENVKVYVQLDSHNVIIKIMSSIESIITGTSLEGYIQIDEGQGDKYVHAQGNYLEKGIRDMSRKYNYKLVDGKVVELTQEEKAILFPTQPAPKTEAELLREQLTATQDELHEAKTQIADLGLTLSQFIESTTTV